MAIFLEVTIGWKLRWLTDQTSSSTTTRLGPARAERWAGPGSLRPCLKFCVPLVCLSLFGFTKCSKQQRACAYVIWILVFAWSSSLRWSCQYTLLGYSSYDQENSFLPKSFAPYMTTSYFINLISQSYSLFSLLIFPSKHYYLEILLGCVRLVFNSPTEYWGQ